MAQEEPDPGFHTGSPVPLAGSVSDPRTRSRLQSGYAKVPSGSRPQRPPCSQRLQQNHRSVPSLIYSTGMETGAKRSKNTSLGSASRHDRPQRPSTAHKCLQTECLSLEVEEKVRSETTCCRDLLLGWRSEVRGQSRLEPPPSLPPPPESTTEMIPSFNAKREQEPFL